MEMIPRWRKQTAQILVIVGWILLLISSLSIGQFQGKVARDPVVEQFIENPSTSTFGLFFAYMFGVFLVTSPGAYLGLAAWALAKQRSGKVLAMVGLCVVVFAVIYNLLP